MRKNTHLFVHVTESCVFVRREISFPLESTAAGATSSECAKTRLTRRRSNAATRAAHGATWRTHDDNCCGYGHHREDLSKARKMMINLLISSSSAGLESREGGGG